jgi:hypothetical protein
MAQLVAKSRTNYFRVKDVDVFRESMNTCSLTVRQSEDGRVCVLAEDTDCGLWPTSIYDETLDDDVHVDVASLIAGHLERGQVCIIQEISYERLRSLTGWAMAINADGEERFIELSSIMSLAKELTDADTDITNCWG